MKDNNNKLLTNLHVRIEIPLVVRLMKFLKKRKMERYKSKFVRNAIKKELDIQEKE